MSPNDLLEKLSDNISDILRTKFEIDITKDYFNHSLSNNGYQNIINEAFPNFSIINSNDLHDLIYSPEVQNLLDYLPNNTDINDKLIILYRYSKLKVHGKFESYIDKLNFVLNSEHAFNFLNTYTIPVFGKFTALPENIDEKEIYIDFISDNITKIGFYFNFNSTLFVNQNPIYFENLKSSFLNKINEINYSSKQASEINWIGKTINADVCQDYLWLSYAFYKHSLTNVISVKSVLKLTSDPLVYYIILFCKKLSKPLAEYSNYITEFNWDTNKSEVLYVEKENICFLLTNAKSLKCDNFTNDGRIEIKGSSQEYLNALKLIIGDKISRQNLKTVVHAFASFNGDFQGIDHTWVEKRNEKKLIAGIKRNIAIYDAFEPGFVKDHFFQYLIESLDQNFIEKLTPKRIAFIKSYFYNHVKENKAEKDQINELPKIRTKISAKQLAILFRLLFEAEIIDQNLEVTNLMNLISSYFATIKSDQLSSGALKKNYYELENSDLVFLKAKFKQMLGNIEYLQNK